VWFDCSGGGGGTGLSPFLDGAAAGRSSVQRGVRGNGVESGRRKGGQYFVYRPPPVVISSADGRGRRCLAGAPPCHCRSARAPLPFVQPEVQSCRLRARRRHEELITARIRHSSSRPRASDRLTDVIRLPCRWATWRRGSTATAKMQARRRCPAAHCAWFCGGRQSPPFRKHRGRQSSFLYAFAPVDRICTTLLNFNFIVGQLLNPNSSFL